VDRLAGSDRFETSVSISKAGYPSGAPVVFVANGLSFPDPLSAGPVAARLGGPLLLTTPGGLPQVVRNEIARLKPSRIVLVGGTAVVSSAVETQARTLATTVQRVAGADRFATSRALVRSAFPGTAPVVSLATGLDFPDALSAGAAAAKAGGPVLLVNGASGALDAETVALLRQLAPSTITLVGGTAAIHPGVATQAKSLAKTVKRVGGTDRFETSLLVNQDGFTTGRHAYLASGYGFPDALAGSALAGRTGSPLYVTYPGWFPRPT
jgi:putative cell wall-binding protein